jgi:hypothetical protein
MATRCDRRPRVSRRYCSWRLDRGQFVMLSGTGQSWRFEESEAIWSRIPAMRPPLQMVRPPQ